MVDNPLDTCISGGGKGYLTELGFCGMHVWSDEVGRLNSTHCHLHLRWILQVRNHHFVGAKLRYPRNLLVSANESPYGRAPIG